MSVKSVYRVSTLAIVAAMCATNASAQMSLPTIDVGQKHKATHTASKRVASGAASPVPSLPAPVASNLPASGATAAASTFIPPGQQVDQTMKSFTVGIKKARQADSDSLGCR